MIPIRILTQPDDETCGPTSLHAVYRYYNDDVALEQVIGEVTYLEEGGTLAVHLGCHALRRGYEACIHTYNLKVFDPTWFSNGETDLVKKLKAQIKNKKGKKVQRASQAYIEFLKLGGEIRMQDLSVSLLEHYFDQNVPVLTGLSSTFLYQGSREYTDHKHRQVEHDVKGYPTGHFVLLCGYDDSGKHVVVADPFAENPVSKDNYYSVPLDRLINAILLGIVTYDANLLIIRPKGPSQKK